MMITKEEYIAQLNEELKKHPKYVEGMSFAGCRGNDWTITLGWTMKDGELACVDDQEPFNAAIRCVHERHPGIRPGSFQ